AVGWSGYFVSLMHDLGLRLPPELTAARGTMAVTADGSLVQGVFNLPAAMIVVLVSALLVIGIKQSANANTALVVLKVCVLIAFVSLGAAYVRPEHLHPLIPPNTGEFGHFGWSGVMRGAAVMFFAYIGFDAVSTAAQETRNPQRTMPIGILGSLALCTVLYVAFAFVLTGMLNYAQMKGDAAPVATAIDRTPFPWLQMLIKIGILCGFTSVILVALLGQSRVAFSMAEDGLLPRGFARVHPRWRTPWRANLAFMVFGSLLAGFVPISLLAHMTSIGTLLAFVIVCAGVLVLRRTRPDLPRPYRTPLVPLVPILGILTCATMMVSLGPANWWRLVVWLAIGLVIYFLYGRSHSRAQAQAAE
ncbi:MAG TPA: amino acid permease, partial [Stellaceae bacterium]|nr:amino acid permease [Stellaceae bacterium]